MRWPWQQRRRATVRGGSTGMVRGFQAMQTSRILAPWQWDGGFSAQDVSSSLATIRSRSRDMAKNSPHMRKFLNLCAVNIVGEMFAFKSTPHDGKPGALVLDQQAAKIIEDNFWKWSNNPAWCDSTGRKTLSQIDRLNAKTWARDGEYFMLIERAQNPYGISLRVLRPDYCAEWYSADRLENGNIVRCGVEMSLPSQRPVAYYMQTSPEHAFVTTVRGALTRIPAEQIIHGFTQEDEDQPRGIPWAHAGLCKLKMLDEYDKAELTAARDEACSVRTYYAPKGDEDLLSDLTAEENASVANALTMDKEPGQSEVLPIGWRQEIHAPQHPNREVTAFKTSMLKDVATAFGVEYSAWANDWSGVSFSSVRAGTIGERDAWVCHQNDMIAQSKSPVFLAWLRSFLALQASGTLPEQKVDKFSEHEFRGRRWMWVDPMKDVRSAEIAVSHKWKTHTQVAADFGSDFAENVEQARREELILTSDVKEAVPVLNGAQVTAALEVVQNYAVGGIGKESAIALLTATGVPVEAAQNMINKQKVEKVPNEAPQKTVTSAANA